MSVPCGSLFKLTGVKLVVLALFVLINVALYARSKYVMEAIFPQFSSNRSFRVIQNFNKSSKSNRFSSLLHYTSLNKSLSVDDEMAYGKNGVLKSHGKFLKEMPFLRDEIVNPHTFRYVITPNVSCANREIELVICVVISPDNHTGRSVIRNTWGSYAQDRKNNAVLVFFIGSNGKVPDKSRKFGRRSKIQEDAFMYGDILQEDYIDSYRNLSLKSVSILKWVNSFCSNTKFILKVDDDMYVNIPFLVKILREHASDEYTPSAFIMGSMQVDAQPIRNPESKWYTPYSVFKEDAYPNYVSGTAYAMTSEAAYLLYEASLRVPRFWLEDIYITGFCSRKASVKVYDSEYFSYGKPATSGCSFKAHVSGHRYTHQEILQIHKELNDPNLWC